MPNPGAATFAQWWFGGPMGPGGFGDPFGGPMGPGGFGDPFGGPMGSGGFGDPFGGPMGPGGFGIDAGGPMGPGEFGDPFGGPMGQEDLEIPFGGPIGPGGFDGAYNESHLLKITILKTHLFMMTTFPLVKNMKYMNQGLEVEVEVEVVQGQLMMGQIMLTLWISLLKQQRGLLMVLAEMTHLLEALVMTFWGAVGSDTLTGKLRF